MNRLAFFITARMGSTRLPKKHFLDLAGQSVMSRLIERVELAAEPADFVVITTGRESVNRAFEPFTEMPRRIIFFGDDLHIPRRHAEAASRLGVDAIVAVDGDDPLISVDAMSEVAQSLRKNQPLCKSIGLPIGMNAWGYSAELLNSVVQSNPALQLDTGWGSIFNGHEFKVHDRSLPGADLLRMTLDYPQDLEFFRKVFTQCPTEVRSNDADLLQWILSNNAHHINSHLNDAYWEHFNSAR